MNKLHAMAEANTNIALVKYWGKNDPRLNLPAVPSLSLTLAGLTTRTEVKLDEALQADVLILNGSEVTGEPLVKVSRHLDRVALALYGRRSDPGPWCGRRIIFRRQRGLMHPRRHLPL